MTTVSLSSSDFQALRSWTMCSDIRTLQVSRWLSFWERWDHKDLCTFNHDYVVYSYGIKRHFYLRQKKKKKKEEDTFPKISSLFQRKNKVIQVWTNYTIEKALYKFVWSVKILNSVGYSNLGLNQLSYTSLHIFFLLPGLQIREIWQLNRQDCVCKGTRTHTHS